MQFVKLRIVRHYYAPVSPGSFLSLVRRRYAHARSFEYMQAAGFDSHSGPLLRGGDEGEKRNPTDRDFVV